MWYVKQYCTENVIWYLLIELLFGNRVGGTTNMQQMHTLVLG